MFRVKMEVIRSSEMVLNTFYTTQCYNPEDHNQHFTTMRTSNFIYTNINGLWKDATAYFVNPVGRFLPPSGSIPIAH
jgi:hypothetical protein